MQVEYVERLEMPGVPHFRCERMRAVLAVRTCAGMWRNANTEEGNCTACLRCPIGATHAGEGEASLGELHLAKVCARCHRPAQRLIGRMHCVSCKNREYEVDRGRNAKGTAPVKLRGLCRRRIRFVAGGLACTMIVARALDTDELVVAAMRDSSNKPRFGLGIAAQPGLRQLRLF